MIAALKSPVSPYNVNQYNNCPDIIARYLEQHARNKPVLLDFGCGQGIKTLSMALRYPDSQVVGVDITEAFSQASKFASDQLGMSRLPDNLEFRKISPGQSLASVARPDFIYSWSVLEHVERRILPDIIRDMYESLNDGGIVFTQIAPLFFSPFGSHLRDFLAEPWAHLIHTHAALRQKVVDVAGLSLDESNRRKWMFDRYEELNRISAAELLRYFAQGGFRLGSEELKRVDMPPPAFLLEAYGEDSLRINEVFLVHAR